MFFLGAGNRGYKRSKSNCYSNCTLLKIDGVRTKEDTQFYVGKRVAYVYKAKKELQGSKFRVMWGKVRRSHGNSGVVRAKFGKSYFGWQWENMMVDSNLANGQALNFFGIIHIY